MSQQKKICSVSSCGDMVECRNLCSLHYSRWQRYGITDLPLRLNEDNPLLFWNRVNVTADPQRCWLWQKCVNKAGYGMVSFRGKPKRCHHIAFFFSFGYWPVYVRHKCDVPACVNPNHLIEGTHKQNMEDAFIRSRFCVGSKHPGAKLEEHDIRDIRKRAQSGMANGDLARDFGVSPSLITGIVKNQKWRHVV